MCCIVLSSIIQHIFFAKGERMIKRYEALLLLNVLCLSSMTLKSKEKPQGPMNAKWFYSQQHQFAQANNLHQQQQWKPAADEYKRLLDDETIGSKYDRSMAEVNLAACLMAQGQATKHWASFDELLDIEQPQRISREEIEKAKDEKEQKTILVRTDQVGIGDIFHFLSAAHELKKRTKWDIVLSVPNFLQETLAGAAQGYNFKLVDPKNEPSTDYETHLVSLLGHLKLSPAEMNPEKVMFTTTERAMEVVRNQINPFLAQGKTIVMVDRGDVGRQATLIGGKQLPRDPKQHGRHLDSEPFNQLLKNHPKLMLLDCSGKNHRVAINDAQKHQYLVIPDEEQPFDTKLALARIMSAEQNIIGFGPDMGQTNVFLRGLTNKAQNRLAIIIPNSKEHDMRMSGEGSVYKHMISNGWVYKCETPDQQTEIIEQAYQDMTK
jgi:hypothetical protein